MERYLRMMRAEIGGKDLWINFLSPENEEFCRVAGNFSDGVHFTADGARRVTDYIKTAVSRWIAEGSLIVAEKGSTSTTSDIQFMSLRERHPFGQLPRKFAAAY
jgi:hypothetical protein